MLTEMAAADAYGVAWEFTDAQKAPNDLSGFHRHPTYENLKAGRYTDDTQRALANTAVVLGDPLKWFSPAAYAAEYISIFERDPREGWSRRFQQYLREHQGFAPELFMRGLNRRATNGAIMGAAPLGFLPDEASVRLAATMQAVSTHSGSTAQHAQCVALAAHYLIRDLGPRRSIREYLAEKVEWDEAERAYFLVRSRLNPPKPAMPARTIAAAAIHAVTECDRLSEVIRWSVSRGGDTDSLAAVATSIASCAWDVESDIPAALRSVEDEEGRERLRRADEALDDHARRNGMRRY